jgi:tellurite resistance protein TerC
MVIEVSDIVFAFDSVPAVIAVSQDPLIVYSAMMFAVLGLRSLFFVLEALRSRLIHLEKSVVILLFFIAGKLALEATDGLFHHGWHISAMASLWVIVFVLIAGVLGSFIFPVHKKTIRR